MTRDGESRSGARCGRRLEGGWNGLIRHKLTATRRRGGGRPAGMDSETGGKLRGVRRQRCRVRADWAERAGQSLRYLQGLEQTATAPAAPGSERRGWEPPGTWGLEMGVWKYGVEWG